MPSFEALNNLIQTRTMMIIVDVVMGLISTSLSILAEETKHDFKGKLAMFGAILSWLITFVLILITLS